MNSYPIDTQLLLRALYSEEGRTYHGLNHIKYLLARADEWFKHCNNVQTLTLVKHAIWWHDAYYSVFDPPGVNEFMSADLFTRMWEKGKVPLGVVDMAENVAMGTVDAAIKATSRHLEDVDFDREYSYSTTMADVCKLMMDVDLVGFAEPLDMVKHHSELVIQEYAAFNKPRQTVLEGRIWFLTKLLERKRIFYTDYFYNTREVKARENLQASIDAAQEELDSLKPKVKTPEPVDLHPHHDRRIYTSRSDNRFCNHAGLEGSLRKSGLGWWLHFDDGTSWHVTSIDNLTIIE